MSSKEDNTHLVLLPSSMAQWHALIEEARQSSSIELSEELESYLVFLLMRFAKNPEIVTSVLALEFLQNQHLFKKDNQQAMRDVGDKCLLFSGLFPKIAERKRVSIDYYVKLGQSAYSSLSNTSEKNELSHLFEKLCVHFVGLMDVLQAIRHLDANAASITLLEAEELWHSTNSAHALSILRSTTQGFMVPRDSGFPELKH